MDYVKLGQRIKERRESLRLSQSDLAHQLGVDQGKVSLTERGGRRLQIHEIENLARVLNVDYNWFFSTQLEPICTCCPLHQKPIC